MLMMLAVLVAAAAAAAAGAATRSPLSARGKQKLHGDVVGSSRSGFRAFLSLATAGFLSLSRSRSRSFSLSTPPLASSCYPSPPVDPSGPLVHLLPLSKRPHGWLWWCKRVSRSRARQRGCRRRGTLERQGTLGALRGEPRESRVGGTKRTRWTPRRRRGRAQEFPLPYFSPGFAAHRLRHARTRVPSMMLSSVRLSLSLSLSFSLSLVPCPCVRLHACVRMHTYT